MTSPSGVAALDLTTGARRWRSSAGDKPLLILGSQLVTQVEPHAIGSRLEVVALNTADGGKVSSRAATVLPASVHVSLGETLRGTFRLTAQQVGGDAMLYWTFIPAPTRGMEDDRESPGAVPTAGQQGAVRVRLRSGAAMVLESRNTAAPTEPRWIVSSDAAQRGVAGTQYESADGRHILASVRVADDRVWDKYRWTVFERATRRRLGEFRTHVSFSPFIVRNSLVVFETTPYERRGQPSEPAKLRAISLTTGREAWSVPVREIVFRGPMPP